MIETYYRILKHGPDGKLIYDSGLIPSHSYVIQFLEMVEGQLDGLNTEATDVDGAENYIISGGGDAYLMNRVDALVGDDTFGIVVGTNAGVTAEDNENYKLDTKILHSPTGESGKLNYQTVTFVAPAEDGGNINFDITRTFLNEHATETITVKEIGIICKNIIITKYHLLLRDVVSDEAVTAGTTLTVVYTLRTTV